MFDTNRAEAGNDISIIQVTDQQPESIACYVQNNDTFIDKLRLCHAQGEQMLYEKGWRANKLTLQTREIPPGHHIVGVYGRI